MYKACPKDQCDPSFDGFSNSPITKGSPMKKAYLSVYGILFFLVLGAVIAAFFSFYSLWNTWTFLICIFVLLQTIIILAHMGDDFEDDVRCDECGQNDCAGRF
jgi:hypothetical protein